MLLWEIVGGSVEVGSIPWPQSSERVTEEMGWKWSNEEISEVMDCVRLEALGRREMEFPARSELSRLGAELMAPQSRKGIERSPGFLGFEAPRPDTEGRWEREGMEGEIGEEETGSYLRAEEAEEAPAGETE